MQGNQMTPQRAGDPRQDWAGEIGGPVYQTAPTGQGSALPGLESGMGGYQAGYQSGYQAGFQQGGQDGGAQPLPAQPGNPPVTVGQEPVYSDQQGVPGCVPGSTQGIVQGIPAMQHPSRGGLDFSTGLTQDALESPMTTQEAYQGSIKGLLGQNLGHYVVATFLVGTQNPISWEGILHSIGNNYLVIFQPDQGRYITGDLYALKFVEFSDSAPGVVSPCTGYRRRDGHQGW